MSGLYVSIKQQFILCCTHINLNHLYIHHLNYCLNLTTVLLVRGEHDKILLHMLFYHMHTPHRNSYYITMTTHNTKGL